jgi:hypothetical protein
MMPANRSAKWIRRLLVLSLLTLVPTHAGATGPKKSEKKATPFVGIGSFREFASAGRSEASVKRAIRLRQGGIYHCFKKALKGKSDLAGKLVVRFSIGPAGKTTDVTIPENTTGNQELADCVIERIQAIKLPAADGATMVALPFFLIPPGNTALLEEYEKNLRAKTPQTDKPESGEKKTK